MVRPTDTEPSEAPESAATTPATPRLRVLRSLNHDWRARRLERESAPRVLSVSQILSRHTAALERDESPSLSTVLSSFKHISFDGPEHEDARAWTQSPQAVEDLCDWLETCRNDDIPEVSLSKHLGCFSAAIERAIEAKALEVNPCRAIPRSLRPKKTPVDPDLGERECINLPELTLIACDPRPDFWDQSPAEIAGTTGLREGELIGAEWGDVEGNPPRLLHCRRQWSAKLKRLAPTKTRRTRRIALSPPAVARIERMRARFEVIYGFSPAPTDPLCPFVPRRGPLLTPEGRPRRWGPQTLLKRWHELLGTLGLDRRRFHALRHSFVSLLVSLGAPPPAVQRLTHPKIDAKPREAFWSYVHANWDSVCAAVALLEYDQVVMQACAAQALGAPPPPLPPIRHEGPGRPIVDGEAGARYGAWTVIAAAAPGPDGRARARCRCDCGGERVVRMNHLRAGQTLSCGRCRTEPGQLVLGLRFIGEAPATKSRGRPKRPKPASPPSPQGDLFR